jgi:transcriptional regulator with XRE-family HTH domain
VKSKIKEITSHYGLIPGRDSVKTLKREFDMRLGTELRKLRKSKRLTQARLAEELETNENYISAIERGACGVGPDVLSRYCDFFGVSQEELAKALPKKEGGDYPPLVQMIIEELLTLPESEQARWLSDLKAKKEQEQGG